MRALLLIALLIGCSGETPSTQAPTAESVETAAAQPSPTEAALAQMPPWADARAAGVDFRGLGQEPGWMLDIYVQERIRLVWNYGENIADFPLTAPTYPQEGATRYASEGAAHTLAITIRRFPCQDAMSGENYPATVEVVIDGATLNGCGRSI